MSLPQTVKKVLLPVSVVCLLAVLSCTDIGYYSQSVNGHLSIMAQRQPIETILAEPSQPEKLKEELRLVLKVREFAEESLQLPVKESFATYADIGRPYVVWNVVAAPAYSLAAYEWCFPVAGCVPYRGYYDREEAKDFAAKLSQRGLDSHLYGVPAYSTLGWFADPVLSSFVDYPDWALAGLIFHELAHQVVYVDNDSDFNEAFASMVEQEGVRRWLQSNRTGREQESYRLIKEREDQFYGLLDNTRQELLDCYDGRNDFKIDERQRCKESAFAQLKRDYASLRQQWHDVSLYDRWFDSELNNARFISSQTYRFFVPAFEELLHRQKGDLPAFYEAVRRLAERPADERRAALVDLRKASIAAISDTSGTPYRGGGKQSAKSGI